MGWKKPILAGLLLCVSSYLSFSYDLITLVGQNTAVRLSQEGSMTEVLVHDPEPRMVPTTELARRLTNQTIKELDPSILVESIYLYKKPRGVTGQSWNETEYLDLYNALRAISTLTGIEYYSASRKRERVLYESSFVVQGPVRNDPLPDPVVIAIPAVSELYARQKDLTFGDNLYRYTYHANGTEIVFIQENLSTMSYGFIPMLGKNRLRSVVIIADAEDSLLVYILSMAKTSLLPGMEAKLKDSFSNRANAIFSWFSDQADKIF